VSNLQLREGVPRYKRKDAGGEKRGDGESNECGCSNSGREAQVNCCMSRWKRQREDMNQRYGGDLNHEGKKKEGRVSGESQVGRLRRKKFLETGCC